EIDAPAFSRLSDCHKLVNEYDNRGNLTSHSIYDQADKAIPDRYGVFRTKYKYDADDNEVEKAFYDNQDKSMVSTRYYALEYLDYKHGLLSEQSFYADVRSPAIAGEFGPSVSIVDHQYDQEGNETSTKFFNTQHLPINND